MVDLVSGIIRQSVRVVGQKRADRQRVKRRRVKRKRHFDDGLVQRLEATPARALPLQRFAL